VTKLVEIPEELIEVIDYAADYIGDATDDWFRIKKQLVNLFPPRERSRFSRRHYSSKKHILNLFDKSVINYWENKTGVSLWIDPEKLHPEDWNPKPRGWGILELNEERAKQKKTSSSETD
jgi:hypothetical protein